MLDLNEIKKYYPKLQGFEKSILREYLQYKILDVIFKSKFGGKMSFLGGTAIRICYQGRRFSEDLDFDNFHLSKSEFEEMADLIKKELSREGYNIEIRTVYKLACHAYIKFSDILFENKLSPMKNEKMMIQVDTVRENIGYNSKNFLLTKFDVFRNINLTPINIVLSKKVGAVFGRKRAKGRDFYDIAFLMELADFNYKYLKEKFNIKNRQDLKNRLLEKISKTDLKSLAKDVEPFLINPDEKERVSGFREYIEQKL